MSFAAVAWINAATGSETTDPVQVLGSTEYAVQAAFTGSPSTGTVTLQGSLDGSNWVTLVSVSVGGPSIAWNKSSSEGPVNFVRLTFGGFTGGSSPTVSASVIAV